MTKEDVQNLDPEEYYEIINDELWGDDYYFKEEKPKNKKGNKTARKTS